MDSFFGYKEIQALRNLISPSKDDSDSEELYQNEVKRKGPGDIEVQKDVPFNNLKPHTPLKEKDDIWHSSEVHTLPISEINDPRKIPDYEIKFKQSVKTEDIFLNMGFKTPGTASCEWISVLIKLPQEVQEKIELSVESKIVDVRSPKYRLHLPTPHEVNPNASHAKWHKDTDTLELTLQLVRELDDINF
ncbi:dynein axonemal assembly factor 6 [Vespa velutina]|uniref:dynein axonemal assembly factor 6 n=1 Tax=Vespa velutina TaxID=202808 RepID=UPI001FB3D015|nr:dynein axonemal assembly factor 6 [Vespa velutina]